jgi:predicted site-specific integrase-resolvase
MTTKELLDLTGISEATLRRWLKEGQPVAVLADCKRDWRGWRIWEQTHVDAIRRYQQEKKRQHELG